MKTNALKKILTLAAVAAIAAPLAAAARPPAQRRAPQIHPGQAGNCAVNPYPAPHGRGHYRPPHGHRPHGYAAWYYAPPPPPPPYWAYYPPPPPPPPPVYCYRPGWSVSFGF